MLRGDILFIPFSILLLYVYAYIFILKKYLFTTNTFISLVLFVNVNHVQGYFVYFPTFAIKLNDTENEYLNSHLIFLSF